MRSTSVKAEALARPRQQERAPPRACSCTHALNIEFIVRVMGPWPDVDNCTRLVVEEQLWRSAASVRRRGDDERAPNHRLPPSLPPEAFASRAINPKRSKGRHCVCEDHLRKPRHRPETKLGDTLRVRKPPCIPPPRFTKVERAQTYARGSKPFTYCTACFTAVEQAQTYARGLPSPVRGGGTDQRQARSNPGKATTC